MSTKATKSTRPRTESVIGSVSPILRWVITDFFKVTENLKTEKKPYSSILLFSGVKWEMNWFPNCNDGKLCIFLYAEDAQICPEKPVTCYVGSDRAVSLDSSKILEMAAQLKLPGNGTNFWSFAYDLDELTRRKHELVPRNILTIQFVFDEVLIDEPKAKLQRLVELEESASKWEEMLDNKEMVDVTIKVKDKEFQCHKFVLACRSEEFKNIFQSGKSEQIAGVVTVEDFHPDTFQTFLRYLYNLKCDSVNPSNAVDLYNLSAKYNVKGLKMFSFNFMKQNISLNNVLVLIAIGDREKNLGVLLQAYDFFNQNFRDVIRTPQWERLLCTDPEFVNKILKQLAENIEIKPPKKMKVV